MTDQALVEAANAARERWIALPDEERNGERPYIMGFNAGWEEAESARAQGAGEPGETLAPAGMKHWPGGDSAPEDWDGGPVARRRSNVRPGFSLGIPGHPDWWKRHEGRGGKRRLSDIIAYTPKAAALSARSVVLEEREACAKVAESWQSPLRPGNEQRLLGQQDAACTIAAAIRARSDDDALSGGPKRER